MPEGTIQDSRNPNSPHWGHLKVKKPKDLNNPPHKDPRQNDKWNDYVLFVNHLAARGEKKKNYKKYYKKKVDFDMEDAILVVRGEMVKNGEDTSSLG